MTRITTGLMLGASALLGACTGQGARPAVGMAPPPPGPPASACAKTGPLLGLDAGRLTQMLGTPRLDIRESTARKLQFASGRCVIDAYLYAPARGKEAVVTHVDARTPAGADTDAASCAATFPRR